MRAVAVPALFALLVCVAFARAQLPQPLQDLRAADGHYLARDDGEPSPADQRVSIWMLLARIADGSTLRSGPHRKEITQLVRWLDARRDDRGRVGLRADPEWRLEQAMATYAFWELLILVRTPDTNIRIDLLLILPVVAIATVVGIVLEIWRSMCTYAQ